MTVTMITASRCHREAPATGSVMVERPHRPSDGAESIHVSKPGDRFFSQPRKVSEPRVESVFTLDLLSANASERTTQDIHLG